jgi:hypothetical protein
MSIMRPQAAGAARMGHERPSVEAITGISIFKRGLKTGNSLERPREFLGG